MSRRLRVAGLFAGIGGIELGLASSGHLTELLCELDPAARAVLGTAFPGVQLVNDIERLRRLPAVDLVTAGFPCQDLSQAGRTIGIGGEKSSLVWEVFRLLDGMRKAPAWLLLENVPFMFRLHRGKAMRSLVEELECRGYTWAYRLVDARAFGLPQRRKRVLILASRTEDPRAVLLTEDAGPVFERVWSGEEACGFYWTEGLRGLGWTVDGVPTLKGGSTIGIPSPPAIWIPKQQWVGTPDIADAERLQGFCEHWTVPGEIGPKARNSRWRLVGNAVSVPIAKWIGERLSSPGKFNPALQSPIDLGGVWPTAAWGRRAGERYAVAVSDYPVVLPQQRLEEFLRFPLRALSQKATAGFLSRLLKSCLRYPPEFKRDLELHLQRTEGLRVEQELACSAI